MTNRIFRIYAHIYTYYQIFYDTLILYIQVFQRLSIHSRCLLIYFKASAYLKRGSTRFLVAVGPVLGVRSGVQFALTQLAHRVRNPPSGNYNLILSHHYHRLSCLIIWVIYIEFFLRFITKR